MDKFKLDNGVIIEGFIGGTVSMDASQVALIFSAEQNTCEALRASLTDHTSTFTVITVAADGTETEGTPSVGFGKIDNGIVSLIEDTIHLTLRKLNTAELQREKMREMVAAGTMTPELYQMITGEVYVP